MFKSLTSVQLDPFQDSVFATTPLPPKAKAEVLLAPDPANCPLAVFKSLTSVQLDPFQDSVMATAGCPPQSNADVEVPVPHK